MRTFAVGLVCLAVMIALLVASYTRYVRTRDLPGLDRSEFLASATPRHIEALRNDSAETRRKAATALWQIGDAAGQATPALLAVVKDPDPAVRAAVLRALGRTSQKTQAAIPALIEALADKDENARAAAATALSEIWAEDRKTGGPLAQARLSPAAETAARPAIRPLAAALRDENPEVRVSAATALSEAGPIAEPAVEDLTRVANEDSAEKARLYAVIALGNIGPPARTAVPALLERLRHDKADGIRANTALALGKIHSDAQDVVPALVQMFLKEEFGDLRAAAVRGLSNFGPEALPAVGLLRAAADDPKYQRRQADIKRVLNQLERNLPKEEGAAPGKPPSGRRKSGAAS
jgi:HEAT repeat protein